MEDTDSATRWEICFRLSRQFYKRFDAGSWYCIPCGKSGEASQPFFRSMFTQKFVKCPRGCLPSGSLLGPHRLSSSPSVWMTCADCDEDLVLRVAERRQACFMQGCQRKLFVDWALLRREASGRCPDADLAR